MIRVTVVSAALIALAACSTEGRLLTPDPEADQILSKEPRPVQKGWGVDPVCGAHLEHPDDVWVSSDAGEVYYFESEECKRKFEEHPDQYRTTVR